MTTDITELAQSLKAAADSVIKNYDCEWFETGSQICTVHKSKVNLISLANPANILALVEALEKAQQTIAFQQGEIKALLSSLESRTVTVKLPSERFRYGDSDYDDGFVNGWNARMAEDTAALDRVGIKWEAE
ncbi:hypothetical protein ACH68I_12140 [Klebsiella aerogenes]|uniref:hypothetical protein n=1 Tax=Klebsiella aerogenes TaxID=548 RepID=UPI0037A30018